MGSIRFDSVNKIFGAGKAGVKALDDINLEIAEKEFVAIVGPSGCGKTTCLRIVAGFERPTSGTVSVNGKPVSGPGTGPRRGVSAFRAVSLEDRSAEYRPWPAQQELRQRRARPADRDAFSI